MTHPTTAGYAVPVTQADREIAARIHEGPPWHHHRTALMVRAGKADDDQIVRAAAMSRLASTAQPDREAVARALSEWLARAGRASKTCSRVRDGRDVMLHMTGSEVVTAIADTVALFQPVAAPASEAALREPDQWRPISEAPKDGTVILLHSPGMEPPVSVGCWDEQSSWREGEPVGWLHVEIDFMGSHARPTHFMPLPAPPAEKGA